SSSVPTLILIDANGVKYEQEDDATTYFGTEINADTKVTSNLNPGITETNGTVFEVGKKLFNKKSWFLGIKGVNDLKIRL
ncbi:MAG: hypothetical protein WCC11_03690, partial [Gammaproteobacteria bacterium]